MKDQKKNNRISVLSARRKAYAVLTLIFFSSFSSAHSQISLKREPSKQNTSTAISKTSYPFGIDQNVELTSRKILNWNHAATPQSIQPVYKTSGKEFYLMFLASVGSASSSDPSLKRIYISARSRTHVKVGLVSGAWQQIYLTNAKGLIAVDLPDWAEMNSNETEAILSKVIKVEAEDEIAVYGFSHKWLSSDGFLVLPVEALGTNYTVASVRNALYYFGGQVDPFTPNSINPRSEFGIAATADNTTVTVTLTADSYRRKFRRGVPYSFTLNKGEAIQIMAHDTAQTGMMYGVLSWVGLLPDGTDCDLTGSQITSDKPIAVFSGHERAGVADSLEFDYPNHPSVSRDHLIEQMPPVENWGKHFTVIASGQDQDGRRPKNGDMIRVISAYDSTIVLVDGQQRYKLIKGTYAQFAVTSLAYIETSRPAMVVKYLRTALPDSAAPGDPDMTVVPPLENMSTFYSLPTVPVGVDFIDHYITILSDSLALGSTTLNGVALNPRLFKPVPGSRYYWMTQRTYAGSQRVESPLPCYAETYGYGVFDSYSFAGGGSFKYLHDLIAKDLDFGQVLTGEIKDSLTGVQSVSVPMPLGDSVTIYGYSWVSGDTSSFDLLDTIKRPLILAPGELLHVNFKFHPKSEGSFKAKLHVWSSNTDDVFINVFGQALSPNILVVPDTIKFGSVRLGKTKADHFNITSNGGAAFTLQFIGYNDSLIYGPFSADKYLGKRLLDPGQSDSEFVHFSPVKLGYRTDSILVRSSIQNVVPIVYLRGRGVNIDIHSKGHFFGKIRIGKSSPVVNIPVSNLGDDTTSIVSISLTNYGRSRDFALDQNSLPVNSLIDWKLDTLMIPDTAKIPKNLHSFNVSFAPVFDAINNIIDTGFDTAIVKLVNTDGYIYYDTLVGIGVEPWLTARIPVLDFGTITNPAFTSPAIITMNDTLDNVGTMVGILQSFAFSNGSSFALNTPIAANIPIVETNKLSFAIDFKITSIGDFIDTLYANNDSRNQPLVILKAKVRAGIEPILPITLGDISSCLPVDTVIVIKDPYRVNITLSSFKFEGDTAGFQFIDTSKLNFPVHIAAGSSFTLGIRYRFPADSLNGTQTVRIIIARPSSGNDLGLGYEYDTVLVSLTRKTVLLNLSAVMPPYRPSAGDQPFRLPIHLNGDRFGKPELDDDTLRLVFSNKLIRPIGVDRTGSLTESTNANGVPPQPDPVWDEATSTYSIPCAKLHLSSDKSKNTLLLTLLCTAYLTKDTTLTITPLIGYTTQPCAYRVAKDSTVMSYANECGDQTIRSILLSTGVPIHINAPVPDPVTLDHTQTFSCTFFAAKDLMLSWKLFDEAGITVAEAGESPIHGGDGSFSIPLKQIRSSGAHVLVIAVRDGQTGAHASVSSKVMIIK